ncbi:MAG: glycogen/starch synthase [Planctomycetes bacterium]|jgi:glycogen synthase|nr:glycogen/starch synthase [Planctomycetota bacterium]
MPLLTLYFQLHQPYRLHPDGVTLLWDEKNREIFTARAQKGYLPTLRLFSDLVQAHYDFKISLGVSGTFLEQAEAYQPEVVDALKGLLHVGQNTRQVEFLEQPYYYSAASFFADPRKTEFKEQVSLHRQRMHDVFGVKPCAFVNTALSYSNEVANIVADMGFKAILCEPDVKTLNVRDQQPIAANRVYRAVGRKGRPRKLAVLPRHRSLSRQIASLCSPLFGSAAATPEANPPSGAAAARQCAQRIHEAGGEVIVLVCDFPLYESDTPTYGLMVEFWKALVEEITGHDDIVPTNPTEVAEWFQITECPMVDCPHPTNSFLSKIASEAPASRAQQVLLRHIESLEAEAKQAGGELVRSFRYLTASDHLRYLQTDGHDEDLVGDPVNPYDSAATAAYALTHATDELSHAVKSFNIRKTTARTPVIVVTPETGRLPSEGMGQFAKYVSGKSGGLGEVISALCKGLSHRNIPVHLVTLNLSRRFREEAGLSEAEWIQTRHRLNPENVHLVSSAIFEGYRSAYDGSPPANAAEFQRQIVNTYVKEIRSAYEGRAILHTNDWMAGGVIMPYARLRGVPALHTVHNTHTGHVPLDMFYGVNLRSLWDMLYLSDTGGKALDCQATAIRNAAKVSYVGAKFLKEIVGDYFLHEMVIPWSVRAETKARYYGHDTLVIPNGISPDMFPENQEANPEVDKPGLAKRYGPYDSLIEARKANLVKFQKKTGLQVDPEAILLYWPSRLDPVQKGVDLLEPVAQKFVDANPGVQIAVIGDPVGGDNWHADVMGRIAYASAGRICYHRFSQDLSTLGYAAAGDVFGASLYEPFGQIDVVGNIYGATATNRDTGGYSDKIVPLNLRAWGAPIDQGNGVLFRDYNADGLWWGLTTAVQNHRYFREHPREWEKQMRRIMKEARSTWSMDNMVAKYITAYEDLNGGKPLV